MVDYPEQSYFPSAKVKLGVRFDELSRRVFTGKIPPKPLKNMAGLNDKRAPLKITKYTEGGVRMWILDYDGSKTVKTAGAVLPGQQGIGVGGPQNQISSEDGLTHVLGGIIPKEATWNQNGVRVADTLNLTIKFIDLPIDPRTVRSCWIEFYLGSVSADDYAAGIEGAIRDAGNGRVEPMNLIPDAYTDATGQARTNLRFQGFVDKWSNDWSETGEPLIRLDCRDNTQLLIDTEAPSKLRIDAKLPIDKAIATYLTHFPQFAGLIVEYRPGDVEQRRGGEASIPQLDKALSKTAFPPRLGPAPNLMLGQPSGMAVWDFLTDVCGSVGHTVRVEGIAIVIQQTRTLYSTEGKEGSVNRPDDPFKGRNGRPFRQFIYGRNILELKNERSFVKTMPTNIEVRCFDPEKKSTIVGRYPTQVVGKGVQSSIPGDGGPEEKWLVWKVSGISNPLTLRIIAQNIYEQLGRQELFVKLKTKNLASFGGGNLDPDILDMRAGDTFELFTNRGSEGVDDSNGEATLTNLEKQLSMQRERNREFMRTLGFDTKFAEAYAKVFTDLGFQTSYRVKAMAFTWNEQGVSIDVDGVNYVEVRGDPINLPNGDELSI